MKSGLEDRNNGEVCGSHHRQGMGLNEVRPGRPEQSEAHRDHVHAYFGGLNEVRPGRPEQSEDAIEGLCYRGDVSMKSGLEDRNNMGFRTLFHTAVTSQ